MSIAITGLISAALVVGAASKDDIVYPVKELGSCRDEAACRTYCDARGDIERLRTCIGFAKKHNLLPPDTLEEAERYVVRLGITEGPGRCRGDTECAAYCEDIGNLNECLDFAARHNLRTPEEIAEGRRVAAALAGGASLPGGCKSKNACEAYCEDPAHMKACISFAKQAGFISEAEAAEAEKIIPLIERGEKTPGNCARKAACEAYCANPSHLDECLIFAERAGLMSAEELAEAKKFAPYLTRGETPGQCKSREICEAYCGDPAHFDECVSFGERVGILSAADAELARKTKGQGPGGCRGRDACEQFCSDPAHQEECVAFAEEHGLADEFSGVAAEVRAKLEAEGRAKADRELRACAERPCSEMIACLQGVGASAGGSIGNGAEAGRPGESGAGGVPPDVQQKLDICIAEEVRIQTERALQGGGEHPEGVQSGAAGEIEKRTREEQQRQYKEEVRRQTEAEIKRQTEAQIKSQVDCSLFAAAPKCEYAAPVGSDNYNYCKQCFPDR